MTTPNPAIKAAGPMPTQAVAFIDLIVSDIDAAIAFYRHLGVEFEIDAQMPGHAGCDLPNGVHMMLDTEESRTQMTAGWTAPKADPRTFITFGFGEPADVDAKYAELVEAGYRGLQEPWDAYWGMRYATVTDPDGNGVDLYALLPQT